MSNTDELRLVWLEKARVALEAKAVWMAAPEKPCQEDNELMDRAAFAFDERNAAWKAYVAAEWDEVRAEEEAKKENIEMSKEHILYEGETHWVLKPNRDGE